jgi:hypothetical protein
MSRVQRQLGILPITCRPQKVLIDFGVCSPMGCKAELAFFEGRLLSELLFPDAAAFDLFILSGVQFSV